MTGGFSGLNPDLNSFPDAVEAGGELWKSLETEISRMYFVAFCFQKLLPHGAHFSFHNITELSHRLLWFIRTVALDRAF